MDGQERMLECGKEIKEGKEVREIPLGTRNERKRRRRERATRQRERDLGVPICVISNKQQTIHRQTQNYTERR